MNPSGQQRSMFILFSLNGVNFCAHFIECSRQFYNGSFSLSNFDVKFFFIV